VADGISDTTRCAAGLADGARVAGAVAAGALAAGSGFASSRRQPATPTELTAPVAIAAVAIAAVAIALAVRRMFGSCVRDTRGVTPGEYHLPQGVATDDDRRTRVENTRGRRYR